MAIEKQVTVDLIEIVNGTAVQVRTKTAIVEDGVQISGSFHRHVINPGECGENEDPRVKAVCAAVHTPEVVAAYQAEQARIAAEQEAARLAAEEAAAKAAAEQDAARAAAEAEAKAAFDAAVKAAVEEQLKGGA